MLGYPFVMIKLIFYFVNTASASSNAQQLLGQTYHMKTANCIFYLYFINTKLVSVEIKSH